MKHIPFVAFPQAEQEALLLALRQLGVQERGVCVTRVEWGGTEASPQVGGFTTVSAPGLCRSYPADGGLEWIRALELDLATERPRA